MPIFKNTVSVIALSAATMFSGHAMASHHFESPTSLKTPALDQLDNFVFQSSRPGYTVFIMTLNSEPNAAPGGTFAQNALYNIHVANDDTYKLGHTFSVAFSSDTRFALHDLKAPNADVGAMGPKLGEAEVGKPTELANGIKIWAGVVKDPFFGNSTSLHLLQVQLNSGADYNPGVWAEAKGKSILLDRKAAAIVLEVPNSMLGRYVKVFMTTAVKKGNSWEQVQYSANPLFSHEMLFENPVLKAEHDRSRPDNSSDMKHFVSARTARASALAKTQADPIRYGDKVAALLVPDVLSYKVGTPAKFSAAERNGRSLDDDAMSAMLTLLLGTPTNQEIANPKLYTAEFPYVIPTAPN